VTSNLVQGEILEAPRGTGGFGYDPVFYLSALGKTFAELSAKEKTNTVTAVRLFGGCSNF